VEIIVSALIAGAALGTFVLIFGRALRLGGRG
jgi:hypothetical protein